MLVWVVAPLQLYPPPTPNTHVYARHQSLQQPHWARVLGSAKTCPSFWWIFPEAGIFRMSARSRKSRQSSLCLVTDLGRGGEKASSNVTKTYTLKRGHRRQTLVCEPCEGTWSRKAPATPKESTIKMDQPTTGSPPPNTLHKTALSPRLPSVWRMFAHTKVKLHAQCTFLMQRIF